MKVGYVTDKCNHKLAIAVSYEQSGTSYEML